MRFQVENMNCGGCARSVTKAVQAIDAAAGVTADPSTGEVQVETSATRETIEAALAKAGFPVVTDVPVSEAVR